MASRPVVLLLLVACGGRGRGSSLLLRPGAGASGSGKGQRSVGGAAEGTGGAVLHAIGRALAVRRLQQVAGCRHGGRSWLRHTAVGPCGNMMLVSVAVRGLLLLLLVCCGLRPLCRAQ